MLTPSEREQAIAATAQAVRDKQVLDRLDKIIELLTEIRDGNRPPSQDNSGAPG